MIAYLPHLPSFEAGAPTPDLLNPNVVEETNKVPGDTAHRALWYSLPCKDRWDKVFIASSRTPHSAGSLLLQAWSLDQNHAGYQEAH